jgi:hypothetical protein
MKTAWILGAGFSRSLGGPLLTELLLPRSREDIKAHFPSFCEGLSAEANLVWDLYSYGCNFKYGRPSGISSKVVGENLWDDAEAFLDYLDSISRRKDDASRQRISNLFSAIDGPSNPSPSTVQFINAVARKIIAAECALFLRNAEPTTERWSPYQKWIKQLTKNDTLISFNYDLVIERLSRDINVILPGNEKAPRQKEGPSLLKLHGSINWKRLSDSYTVTIGDEEHAISCAPQEMCIATPGPSKAEATSQLSSLWELAESAIQEADAIFFVGYRFPQSDATSRERLLTAIINNKPQQDRQGTPKSIFMHIVLGPDLSHKDVVRMTQLLQHIGRYSGRYDGNRGRAPFFIVTPHALFAEDFFTIFRRESPFIPGG